MLIGPEKFNSLNTFGEENSSFFYQELKKGLTYQPNEKNYYINPLNFTINHNFSSLVALTYILRQDSKGLGAKFNKEEAKFLEDFWKRTFEKVYDDIICEKEWVAEVDSKNGLFSKTIKPSDYLLEKPKSIPLPASKTIFALHFELIRFNNGKILEGINSTWDEPLHFELQRTNKNMNYDFWGQVNIYLILVSFYVI